MNEIMTAEFRGATLYASRHEDQVYVALKPMVEAMGLAWHGQLERVKRHLVLSQGIRVTRIPSPQGEQATICLRLDLVPGWLLTIDARRVNIAARDNVVAFQLECFAVLWRHFSDDRELAKDASENTSLNLRLCTESRHIHGNLAAAQLWEKLRLPKVPEMDRVLRQAELFDALWGEKKAA